MLSSALVIQISITMIIAFSGVFVGKCDFGFWRIRIRIMNCHVKEVNLGTRSHIHTHHGYLYINICFFPDPCPDVSKMLKKTFNKCLKCLKNRFASAGYAMHCLNSDTSPTPNHYWLVQSKAVRWGPAALFYVWLWFWINKHFFPPSSHIF